jgi:hypothetical protein
MKNKPNDVKEKILDRLHKLVGICNVCGKKNCGHTSTNLPNVLKTDDVLRAINYDNYYGDDV